MSYRLSKADEKRLLLKLGKNDRVKKDLQLSSRIEDTVCHSIPLEIAEADRWICISQNFKDRRARAAHSD